MNLPNYIASSLETRFEWGKHDCILFAATWVQLATGIDHLAGFQPWRSQIGAARLLKSVGGLEAAIDRALNRIHPHSAKDGDIALQGNTVWIFTGPHLVAPGESGLFFIDRTKAECAWSI